jgi:hypothetical protein
LCVAHVAAIGLTPSGTEVAKDIYRLFCQLLSVRFRSESTRLVRMDG